MPDRFSKELMLGTALWGWGVDKREAFALLDAFVDLGGQYIDAATNYPINGVAEDFGRAAAWLGEWIKVNSGTRLAVLLKVGSKDNLSSPDSDLSPRVFAHAHTRYQDLFCGSLRVLAVHWDGREKSEASAIAETVQCLDEFNKRGMEIGFSGVKAPEIYQKFAPHLADKWMIQVKENALTRAARNQYAVHFPAARYFAYGINMGGVKSRSNDVNSSVRLRNIQQPLELIDRVLAFVESENFLEPKPNNLIEFSLALAMFNPRLSGAIIGPRNGDQLTHTLNFSKSIRADSEVYERICAAIPLYN